MSSLSPSADRISGLIWIVFGAAIVYGSWTMDRLEHLGIPPATAPGVPTGLLGIAFVIFGLVLLLRRNQPEVVAYAGHGASVASGAEGPGFAWPRTLLSGALCLAYAGGLLGRGLPFWLLTFAFLFAHLMLLDETDRVPARPTLRRFIAALVIAPAVTVVITLVFSKIFLVRLP